MIATPAQSVSDRPRYSQKGYDFYKHLVKFLSPAYPDLDPAIRDQISTYSYDYFKFMLVVDALVDNKDNTGTDAAQLLNAVNSFEDTIKGLAFLFTSGSDFWIKFDQHKKMYYRANLLEKKISEEREAFTPDLFLSLARGKSAVCNAIVDALGILTGSNENEHSLKTCLEQFHIACQYRDDLDDFKRDIENKQYTYIYHSLVEDLKGAGVSETDLTTELKHKYLFLSGLASKWLEHAAHHYSLALEIAETHNLTDLSYFLLSQIESCERRLQEINDTIKKTRAKAKKSQSCMPVRHGSLLEVKGDALIRSIGYLDSNVNERGLWEDFLTGKGISDHWVTSYAALQLAESLNTNISIDERVQALISRLKLNTLKGAYNDKMINDGDSLNFLVAISRVTGISNRNLELEWLSFASQNFGWVTYNDADALKNVLAEPRINVTGWLTEKCCVTAAACYVLSDISDMAPQYHMTCEYLAKNQHAEGYWEAYWWTSNLYATTWAVRGMLRNPVYEDQCSKAIAWIIKLQTPNGCWDDPLSNEPSAFYTSLCIKALLSYNADLYSGHIKAALHWLAANQMSDGSWRSPAILRIPATEIDDVNQVKQWRKGCYGPNIIVEEFNRIMTTSAAINAISHSLRRNTVNG